MNPSLKLILSVVVLVSQSAQAEFIDSDDFLGTASDVVIDNSIIDSVVYEEPSFGSRSFERDVAQTKSSEASVSGWQGQLVVLKEIPYSYPQLTRHTLELRALAELEAKEN